jgi:hypothetical protein
MVKPVNVSADVYEDLCHFYKDFKQGPIAPPNNTLTKRSSLSPRILGQQEYLYDPSPCLECQ